MYSRLFGSHLKTLRQHRELKLTELADMLRQMELKSARAPFLSRLERGKADNGVLPNASISLWIGCSEALEAPLAWFLTNHKNITHALPQKPLKKELDSLTPSLIDGSLCHFHKQLRALRLKNGLSQQQLAAAIGISQSSYFHIEQGKNGNKYVTVDQAAGLAAKLGIPVQMLFADSI
jgi:transcriptional regulator with XRE-family HTH domain